MITFMNRKGARKVSSAKGKKNPVDEKKQRQRIPSLQEFIQDRDYTGAVTLLNFNLQSGQSDESTLPWLGFSYFHKGDYALAESVYAKLLSQKNADTVNYLYSACCHFYMGDFEKAEELALMGPDCPLQLRIRFHCAQRLQKSDKLVNLHQAMLKREDTEDQLSLASMHYTKVVFQEATDIYKRLLIEFREYLALQVYVALCYYKLDYYEVSNEILAPYLAKYPTSIIAVNLKAANMFKLYEGKAAEAVLKELMDLLSASSQNVENDLIRHNLVVFRKGENALQVLPPLVDVIPEARLNLVIHYLNHDNVQQAFELMEDFKAVTPAEYILKGVVHAAMGQNKENGQSHIDLAKTYFSDIGGSSSECDTIPGRQCMASVFFLLKQFDDVLIYLNSIKTYMEGSPWSSTFHFNYGLTLASVEQFKEAEAALLLVTDERIKRDYTYISWLARCYIMNGKAREAWELHTTMENSQDTYAMLVLISNDAYKTGAFYYAAKAFELLDRMDPSAEHWPGKRGACCGVFQQVVAGKETKAALVDIIGILRNTNPGDPQAELIVRIMLKWAGENGLDLSALS